MQATGITKTGVIGGEAPATGITLRGDVQWEYIRALAWRTLCDWERDGRVIRGDRGEALKDCMVAAYLATATYDGPEALIGVYARTLTTGRAVAAYCTYDQYAQGEADHTCRGGKVIKREVVATRLGEDRKPLLVNALNIVAKRAVRAVLRGEKWRPQAGSEVLEAEDTVHALKAPRLTVEEELEVRYVLKQFRQWLAENHASLTKRERQALADLTVRPIEVLGAKARWRALQALKTKLAKAGVLLLTPEEEGEIIRKAEAEKARDRQRKAKAYRRQREERKVAEAFKEAFGEKTRDREAATATG